MSTVTERERRYGHPTLSPRRRTRTDRACPQRSYWYTQREYEYDDVQPDVPDPVCPENDDDAKGANCTLAPPLPGAAGSGGGGALGLPLARTTYIDAEFSDDAAQPRVVNGVKMGEGDGTVSLLSLGAMCVEGWKRPRWNPAGIEVTTVEVRATVPSSSFFGPRGPGGVGVDVR